MTEGGLTRTPAAGGEGGASERSPADDREVDGRAPAVPLSLLAMARDETWPADDLLWEWGRWEPTSPFDAMCPEDEPDGRADWPLGPSTRVSPPRGPTTRGQETEGRTRRARPTGVPRSRPRPRRRREAPAGPSGTVVAPA